MNGARAAMLWLLVAGCGGGAGAAPPRSVEKDKDGVTDSKPKMVVSELGTASDELDAAATQLGAASDCAAMCKALASMRKAADHLCALTKDGGDDEKKRCDGAKEKVAAAETKVKTTCGGCGP